MRIVRSYWRSWRAARLERRAEAARRTADAAAAAAQAVRDRATLEALAGQPLVDLDLYRQALRHRSAVRGQRDSHRYSNERLEYLGDAVLGLVVGAHLYETFPDTDEGFLSRLRAKLVSGAALAHHAREAGFGPLITMSTEMRQSGGEDHATLLADALEAFIGALYLDKGLDAARLFVERTVLNGHDLDALASHRDNYKSVLLEQAQGQGWPQPTYSILAADGASHARIFTVEVYVCGESYGVGQASSKKQAEQLAARAALERLAQNAPSGDGAVEPPPTP
ncbi:MAG: ribonuclease III [Rhodothermales bacterium]|nr:ribonuclease III [Rhodothermales bacterium]MCA0268652.1 ribonuclease III [Bacteroidota bacterium]